MLVKCNLALAIETFVLIAAIFLFIYIQKNELSKWFRYAGIAIIAFVLGLMLCSMLACCRIACKQKMEMQYRHDGFMRGECSEGRGECSEGRGECSEGRGECSEGRFEGRMGHGRMGMHHRGRGESCEMDGKCEMGKGSCEMESKCEMGKGACPMEGKGEMGEKKECCMKADSAKKAMIPKKK
jgi:hypothetical protein